MKITQEVWESVAVEISFSQRELAYEKELREYEQYKKEQIRNHRHVRSFEDWRRS